MGARLLEQTFTRDKLRQALIVFFSLSPRQPPFKESSPPRSGALRKARLARQSLARLRAVLGTVTAVFVAVSVASVVSITTGASDSVTQGGPIESARLMRNPSCSTPTGRRSGQVGVDGGR